MSQSDDTEKANALLDSVFDKHWMPEEHYHGPEIKNEKPDKPSFWKNLSLRIQSFPGG